MTEKKSGESKRSPALEQFLESFSDFNLPAQGVLDTAVEKSTKCGDCGGEVRAVCGRDVQPSGAPGTDLEILVDIYCPDPKCSWRTSQWRPWSRHRPKEL